MRHIRLIVMAPLSASPASGLLAAPLWRSGFRPFFLLGTAYGVLFMLGWLEGYVDLRPALLPGMPIKFWHGHEIVFGFASAIITGIMLTALPSWAGTEEIKGSRLALLVALWLAGRVALWLAPWLPTTVPATVDCALFPAITVLLGPQLLRARNKLYLLLLPVLAALCAANIVFYLGSFAFGLRLAIYSIMLLYALAGGVLAPVFTGNALREKKRGDAAPPSFALDALAAVSVALLAAADLAALPPSWIGGTAAVACVIHALRLARWRGWRVLDVPLVFAMHAGYAWLVVALGLQAAARFTDTVPEPAWLHAFTVGALSMMMLGLMTRVALRHTGRPMVPPPAIVVAYALMFIAALLRVSASLLGLERGFFVIASAVLWIVPFLIYLALFGPILVRPSTPVRSHG